MADNKVLALPKKTPTLFRRTVWLGFIALLVALAALAYHYYQSLGAALITSPLSFYTDPFSPTNDTAKRAYATTLYDDGYLPGALLLGYSLRKHGMLDPSVATHMLLLYIPGRLSEHALHLLQQAGWQAYPVDHIPHPKGRLPAHNFMDQYTKLRLFEADHYDQIFYMDADMLVVRPFPEIWSFPAPLAATRDVRMGHGWLPSINAGSLLLKPNKAVLSHMLEIAPIFKYNTVFAEQGLLNAYWSRDITILPYIYNGQLGVKRVFPKIWEAFKGDVRILHYTGLKPWQWHAPTDMPIEREQWWATWDEMEAERVLNGLESLGSLAR